MAVYKYTAADSLGSRIAGTYEAMSEQEVRIYLRANNLTPIKIGRSVFQANISFSKGVKSKDLIIFTRMFSAMAKAAVPLDQALKVLHDQTDNQNLKRTLQRLIVDVESGLALSEAMKKQPVIFDTLYVNMIAAGEASGNLDVLMARLADLLERDEAIRGKVKSAMIYPMVLSIIAAGSVSILLIFVLPQFMEMFESSGVPLPLPTRVAIGASKFLTGYWWVIVGAMVGFRIGRKSLNEVPGYVRLRDGYMLRIPVIGQVVIKGACARFSRTLATLVGSGVSIMDGLDLVAETAGNVVVSKAIHDARASIANGTDIADPLKKSGVFPQMLVAMVSIGEQSGQLDLMLAKVADFYETDVNTAVDNALKLIEPVMLVVMGVLVGGIMASLYLPMFDMISVVGNG